MRRADRHSKHCLVRRPMRRPVHRQLMLALGAAFPLCVAAQSAPPAGSPTDVRYTEPTAGVPALYPRSNENDAPPKVFLAGDYAANAAVGRIVVEADRNAVPADGQSAVKLKVRVYGRDGAPLKAPAFLTIEHSGGRVLLPNARTDELGPRRQDADLSLIHI